MCWKARYTARRPPEIVARPDSPFVRFYVYTYKYGAQDSVQHTRSDLDLPALGIRPQAWI
jgi:hypothetical protein